LILFSIQKTAPEAYVSPVSTTSLIVESSLSRTSGTDTDQDGLKDWEEVLWKTDPNNPDTDGDGVNDGDEVVQGRSPVGQGNLSAKTISGTYISNQEETLTETDKFSRAFFEEYLLAKQTTGSKVSPITQENIIQELMENQKPFVPKTYTRNDLFIEPTVSLKSYGNNLGKALSSNPLPQGQKHEIDIFEAAIASERAQDLAGLSPIIDSYKSILRLLLALRVPEKATDPHLNLINKISKVIESIESMRSFFEDPIRSLPAIAAYSPGVKELTNSFAAFEIFFLQHKVTFQQSEYGYLFVNGL